MNIVIEKLVPRFLLEDKNGYAIAKAIEAGFRKASEVVDAGKALLTDYDTMPEWRVDEIAWETNAIYDYTAGLDQKRDMIKSAVKNFRLYGTPAGIKKYLEPYFDAVEITEGVQPFRFGVMLSGDFSKENIRYANYVIQNVKNVRSIYDGLTAKDTGNLGIEISDRPVVLDEFILDVDTLG